MTSAQNYHFADVQAHAQLLKAQAASLEQEHQAILASVNQAADFWGGAGNSAFTDFVAELNRNFQVIFEQLGTHGDKVSTAGNNTEHGDAAVQNTWV